MRETHPKNFVIDPSHVYLDVDFYKTVYPDLTNMTRAQLKTHWVTYGAKERRCSSAQTLLLSIPYDFDPITYMSLNPDVGNAFEGNTLKTMLHYYSTGMFENRPYRLEGVDVVDTRGANSHGFTLQSTTPGEVVIYKDETQVAAFFIP